MSVQLRLNNGSMKENDPSSEFRWPAGMFHSNLSLLHFMEQLSFRSFACNSLHLS